MEVFKSFHLGGKFLFKACFFLNKFASELVYFFYSCLFLLYLGNFSFQSALEIGYFLRGIFLKLFNCLLSRLIFYKGNDIVREVQNVLQVSW